MSDISNQEIKRGRFAKEKGEIIIREHVYDGIEEYDQKLPNWWLFTFYIAIVWFVGYWTLYYHTGVLQTDQQKIEAKLTAVEKAKAKELDEMLAKLDDKTLITKWATDPTVVAAGLATFTTNCKPCHGEDLSATMDVAGTKIPLPGRSLIDGQWTYGNKPMDLFKLVREGTPADKPGYNGARMQAWGQLLTPKQIAEVVSYVISKNPKDFPPPP
jgi:cytochrome c oxidase cbb3-type subunit III